MKETTFKNILHSYVVTFILTLVKTIIYPYSFAPDELAKAIKLYDETQPMASVFEIMFLFLMLIVLIVSIFRLYKWKKNGRLLFLISTIGFHLSIFMFGYYVFDSIEYLLDGILGVLSGIILCAVYYTNLKTKFKK